MTLKLVIFFVTIISLSTIDFHVFDFLANMKAIFSFHLFKFCSQILKKYKNS